MTPDPMNTPDNLALASRLFDMVGSSWMTQALYAATRLEIADLLADGPRKSQYLAEATRTHAPSLLRLLRALVTLEICREHPDGSFAITPMGLLLRRDTEISLHSWVLFWGGTQWKLWGHLLESVQTGQSARSLLVGTEGFQHLEQDAEAAAIFNRAMVELTRLIAQRVASAYDFSGMKRIVDVGGGYGELLAAILHAHPQAQGVLFDRPHAVESGRLHLAEVGLEDRCEFVTGDFFESIPPGADAYVLKSIIHDWNDTRSKAILETCRRAMTAQARLLLVEQIMPETPEPVPPHRYIVRSDLNMLVALGGQERTEKEFRELLASAGFRLTRVVPVTPTQNVLEAVAL